MQGMQQGREPLYAGSTVAELYRSAFKSFAQREAIVGDGVRLSYQALEAQCHRMVRYFESIGLRRQDGISLLSGNRADAVVAIIAAQLMGLRYTALHPLAAQDDHVFALRDAGIKALIVDVPRFAERGAALAALGVVEHVLTLGPASFGADVNAALPAFDGADIPLRVQPEDISKISYTGGTTGKSKGVIHRQRTTVTMTLQQLACWEWPAQTRFLAATPISHASGAIMLPVLLRGGTLFFMSKFSPEDFLQTVVAERISSTFLVPTQIYGLLDCETLDQYDLSPLQMVLYGAAPIAEARLAQAVQRLGPVFCQIYGQAEAPMTISYLRRHEHDPRRPQLLRSCGRPLPGNQVKLLDANLREVGPGEVGELCVRGPLIMHEYLNRPEETEKAFAGDWLHTGDMARQDADGYLYIVDRAKDMIISGGFNVYSSEVENCLAQHPAVSLSAVIGLPHPKWGEAVTAVVVLKPGCSANAQELIAFVAKRKGVVNAPKTVVFEANLPLTAVSKLDKKAIRAMYAHGNANTTDGTDSTDNTDNTDNMVSSPQHIV